jgi:DNA invertase Pin-like site-specific DNA recombinase
MPKKPRLIGYMRVSRSRQKTLRQEDALAAAKCAAVFCDKISGKKWKRDGLDAALAAMKPGSCLAVDSIDRLGRSALEILMVIAQLHQKGACLLSLSQGCRSDDENGYIQCLFHAVFAEIEHTSITRRTRDGIHSAMARGKRRGGKPKMTPRQACHAQRLITGGMTADVVAARYSVGRSTLFRHLRISRLPLGTS